MIYVCANNGVLYAVSADEGLIQWTAPADQSLNTAPTFYDGIVYARSSGNRLCAIDAASGTEQGQRTYEEQFNQHQR